jgi:DNA polymerase
LLTIEAREALTLRLAGAKASIKKLPKILEQLSADDRLRWCYAYYKAHTGRWAGKGPQLQNLRAPRTKEEKAMVAIIVDLLERGEEAPTLDALSLALRSLLTAPKGKKVVLADFKSVENRVLAWESGCDTMLQVYLDGKDPYIDFAARMDGCDYSDVTAEMRQQAKAATLGAGFGLGGGQLVRRCKCSCKHVWNVSALEDKPVPCPMCGKEATPGIPVKTGLWRYAEMMGIDLSQEQSKGQVETFRDTFMEVAQFWYHLENAFKGCTLTRRDQTIKASSGCVLVFRWRDPALRIVLPSGRELVFPDAWAREDRTPFGGKRLTLGFESSRGNSWGVHNTYGGRLCENITQGIAVDLLVDAMERVEADPRFEIVGHTHDELICLADENDAGALDRLIELMSMTEPWAVGLPMAADGYEGKRYGKG